MREEAFRRWLEGRYPLSVAATRLANVRRIEAVVGDLDDRYRVDELQSVLDYLQYSRADEVAGVSNPSGIEIKGSVYDGLATLKSAVKLYREFRSSRLGEVS